jgi:hypothetical protein
MSGKIIQDESSNVTGIPADFDNSLSSWVDLKNSFCEVDRELDQLTLNRRPRRSQLYFGIRRSDERILGTMYDY